MKEAVGMHIEYVRFRFLDVLKASESSYTLACPHSDISGRKLVVDDDYQVYLIWQLDVYGLLLGGS